MVRRCTDSACAAIEAIINEAGQAYRGVIPADCWREPYMPRPAPGARRKSHWAAARRHLGRSRVGHPFLREKRPPPGYEWRRRTGSSTPIGKFLLARGKLRWCWCVAARLPCKRTTRWLMRRLRWP